MDEKNTESHEIRRWVYRALLFIYDAFVVNFSYFFAIILRFYVEREFNHGGDEYMEMFWRFVPYYTAAALIVFLLFRLYSSVWRYAGMNDIRRLALANLCTCVLQIAGTLILIGRMPLSYYGLGAFFQFILMSVPRTAPRFIIDSFRSIGGGQGDLAMPLLIVGVDENARIIQSKVLQDKSNIARPVCVVDYRGGSGGGTFNGLPVFSGRDGMQKAIEKYAVRCVIIADDGLPERSVEEIRMLCEKNEIEFRSFEMKVEIHESGMKLKELLEKTTGPVRIVNTGGGDESAGDHAESAGDYYENAKDALKKYRFNFVVDDITRGEDALQIGVHPIRSTKTPDEDWMEKFREENGNEVSFFI